jgi:hypothetical protein
MLSPDVRPSQYLSITPGEGSNHAEELISTIAQVLGNSYFLETRVVTDSSPDDGVLVFRTVGFKRKGILGLNSEHLGARTLLTLVTDTSKVRALSADEKNRQLLETSPRQIVGWMPQDGRSLVEQTIWPEEDIPEGIRFELGRVGSALFCNKRNILTCIFRFISANLFSV